MCVCVTTFLAYAVILELPMWLSKWSRSQKFHQSKQLMLMQNYHLENQWGEWRVREEQPETNRKVPWGRCNFHMTVVATPWWYSALSLHCLVLRWEQDRSGTLPSFIFLLLGRGDSMNGSSPVERWQMCMRCCAKPTICRRHLKAVRQQFWFRFVLF